MIKAAAILALAYCAMFFLRRRPAAERHMIWVIAIGSAALLPLLTLLLPASSEEWPIRRKRVVLAHELAHIQRADWLFQILAELACIVYWFNPLFWVARNRLDFESERACDDAVLNLGFDGQDYATHLLEIARALKKQRPAWLPALAMAKPFGLEARLVAILNASLNRRR